MVVDKSAVVCCPSPSPAVRTVACRLSTARWPATRRSLARPPDQPQPSQSEPEQAQHDLRLAMRGEWQRVRVRGCRWLEWDECGGGGGGWCCGRGASGRVTASHWSVSHSSAWAPCCFWWCWR